MCVCANLRAVTRVVTQAFDTALVPSGLTVSQFTLMFVIGENGTLTVNELAELLTMDATTLTRGLKPLIKQNLVASAAGADRRTRHISLTAAGREALDNALPLWQTAQSRVTQYMGQEHFESFLSDLYLVAKLVR